MDNATYLLIAGCIVVAIFCLWIKDLERSYKDIILTLNTRLDLLEGEIRSLRTSSKMTQIRHDLLSKRVNRNIDDGQRDLS